MKSYGGYRLRPIGRIRTIWPDSILFFCLDKGVML